jgi:hypothetical protein
LTGCIASKVIYSILYVFESRKLWQSLRAYQKREMPQVSRRYLKDPLLRFA